MRDQTSQNCIDNDALTIYYQNARGLNTKTRTFYNQICHTDEEYVVIGITESWLTDGVYDGELFPSNFVVFRNRNREDSVRGGGVLLAVKNVYKCNEIKLDIISDDIDMVCVKLFSSSCNSVYIILVYIRPTCSFSIREEFFELLENLTILHEKSYIILGDFNIARLGRYYIDDNFKDNMVQQLLDFLSFFDCKQFNMVTNYNGHILDLVLSCVM